MSDTPSGPPRPRQVTMAAYTIMAGSVLVVLFVFDTFANLNTLATREAVESFLSEPPGAGLGMGVDGALTVMRALGMVAAGCATAAAILGYQVLKPNRTARIALTVLAVPLLLAGMVTGGFLSSIVAACAFLLWLPPARDWFDGKEAAKPHALAALPAPTQVPPPAPLDGPRAVPGWGSPESPPPAQVATASARPTAVLYACLLTWLGGGLGATAMIIGLAFLAIDPDRLMLELRAQNPDLDDSGLSDGAILAATFVTGVALVVWMLAAVVLAVLLYRGVSWSRIVLVVSTGAALGLLGLAALSQFLLVLPFVVCAFTMTLLLRPETRAWVAARP